MHIALAIDRDRLKAERDWYNRTVVGLLQEGNQVIRLLPQGEEDDPRVSLAPAVRLPPELVRWASGRRWDLLADDLLERGVDIIHAFGSSVWRAGFEVSRRNGRALLIDVRSAGEVNALASWRPRRSEGLKLAYTAATSALAGRLSTAVDVPQAIPSSDRAGLGFVHLLPLGVHVPTQPEAILTGLPGCASLIVAARGASWLRLRPALEAAAEACRQVPGLMVFLDCSDEVSALAWRRSRELEFLDRLTFIPRVELHRRQSLCTDVVLIPDCQARASTYPLEVMGAGIPLLALEDPLLDFVQPIDQSHRAIPSELRGQAARSVWMDALMEVFGLPEHARLRGAATRRWTLANHPMSVQLTAQFSVYAHVSSGLLLDL